MLSDHPLLFVQGFMEYSYMFYGYYNNTMVEDSNFSYNIPLAYLFTAVFYFAFCLICLIARSVPELSNNNRDLACVCVFCVCVYVCSAVSVRVRVNK